MAKALILLALSVAIVQFFTRSAVTGTVAESLDVTEYVSFAANSTCGDTPTTEVSEDMFSCFSGDHDAQLALDGDLGTWWQSENGESPVQLTFTLENNELFVSPAALRLQFRSSLPLNVRVDTRSRSSNIYDPLVLYVVDGSCDQYMPQGIPCFNISDSVEDSSAVNVTSLLLPLTFTSVQQQQLPVFEIRVTVVGYQQDSNLATQFYAIAEATVYAKIAPGYYARSLHSIAAQGEGGLIMETGESLLVAVDEVDFPGFVSRGYAVFDYGADQRVMVQYMLPSLPRASRYRIVFRYANPRQSRRFVVRVTQGSKQYTSRVTLDQNCVPPCDAFLTNSDNTSQIIGFDFDEGPVVIQMSLSSVYFLLDSIIALPQEFYMPANFSSADRFLQECDITETLSSQFCVQAAQELSIQFFEATYACACQSSSSSTDVCEPLGGQCSCLEPTADSESVTGRQCDLCPFYTYFTSQGCTPCDCPNQLDMCDMTSGQCSSCPQLVVGRACDSCVPNSFGDPISGCEPCTCDIRGTESCDQVSGDCLCKVSIAGPSCDRCAEGFFNFSSNGCDLCDCDGVGSEGVGCDASGQCTCKVGVSGTKCSECIPGFFALSSDGCTACNCSGRTSVCSLDPSSTSGETPMNISSPPELCSCPLPYTGASCEGCVDGFYLSDTDGICVQCECNGRAQVCAEGNGNCINCTSNSTGFDCELCLDGFYDSDPEPDLACLSCPCDPNTTVNTLCSLDESGSPVCFCSPGHVGRLCDTCAEGYFGAPPEFRCTSCDCNGNIDPDIPMSCDRNTGVCLLCINSTGDECQFCEVGFFGDATNQDCQQCDCFEEGSDSSLCNSTTGQCSCLEGVGGQSCGQCQPRFWNFTSGVGCEPCTCGEGSASLECDELTGTCPCNPGVGGDECSMCLDSFYDFSSQGCTACGCGIGSVNSSCTTEGRCYCQPGVMGDKCDLCQPFNFDLSPNGCQPCGECEQMIRILLQSALTQLGAAEMELDLFTSLYNTDINGNRQINNSLRDLENIITITRDLLSAIDMRLENLELETQQFDNRLNVTLVEIDDLLMRVNNLLPFAEDVNEHIQNVYNTMQTVLIDIVQINSLIQPLTTTALEQEAFANAIETNVTRIVAEHNSNYSEVVLRARASLDGGIQIDDRVTVALSNAQTQSTQALNITQKYSNIELQTEGNISTINELESIGDSIRSRVESSAESARQLTQDINTVKESIDFGETTLENVDLVINEVQYALMRTSNQLEELTTLLEEERSNDDNVMMGGSGSGSGSGSGMIEPEPTDPETPITSLNEGINLLRVGVSTLIREIESCEVVLQRAENHVIDLQQEAEQISSTLIPSLTTGNNAVGAIVDYMNTISTIEEALNITNAISATIQQLQIAIGDLMVASLEDETNDLLENSMMYQSEALRLSETIANLSLAVRNAQSQVDFETNETKRISSKARELRHLVNGLQIAAGTFSLAVSRTLNSIDRRLTTVENDYLFISTAVPDLLAEVVESLALVNETQNLSDQVCELLVSTNSSLLETREFVRDSVTLLDSIRTQSTENDELLEDIETGINSLAEQLASAQRAVASIDVALRFYGNTSLSYPLPSQASSSSNFTSISLIFRPSQIDYGTLFYTSSVRGVEPTEMVSSSLGEAEMDDTTAERGVSLRLFNGSIQYEYDPSGMSILATEEGVLQTEEWYQVFATRDTDSAYLSVSSLQGGDLIYTSRNIATLSDLTTPLLTANSIVSLGEASVLDETNLFLTPDNNGFVGCIDRVVINNAQLPLFLPNERTCDIATCGPRPPAEVPRLFESGAWLQGAGSFILLDIPSIEFGSEITFSFRTHSQDGTILYILNQNYVSYVTVFLYSGFVVLEYSQTGLDVTQLQTTSTYSDNQWYTVSVVIEEQVVMLAVNNTEMLTGDGPIFMLGAFNNTNYVSIGNTPSIVDKTNSSRYSIPGCVRDFVFNNELLNLQNYMSAQRVVFGRCPRQVSAGVRFMGDGHAQFEAPSSLTLEDLSSISLDFRTTQLAAHLLQVDTVPQISLSLFHTYIRVDINSSSYFVSVANNLNDNRWHSVALVIASGNITLSVDGNEDTATLSNYLSSVIQNTTSIFVGGTPDPQSAVIAESFRGCIRNVEINERMLDFNTALILEGVALYGCRPPSVNIPVPPPPPPLPPPPSTRPNITVGLEGIDGTFIAVPLDLADIRTAYSIILQFQASSSDALLIYAQDVVPIFADYIALEMRGGRLYYSYNLGSGRVFIVSNETYNDGEIHTVELRRLAQFGEMIIDEGFENQSGVSPREFADLNINSGLLFVGGIPSHILSGLSLLWPGDEEPNSALACFHSLSINSIYVDMSSPHAMSGAGSCLETYNNVATFSPDSYLQILENFNAGTRFSFSLRFRTASCSGVLVYVHTILFPDHVVIELFNGTMRFVFDNGPLETIVEYTPDNPRQLCDSQWHSINVDKFGVRGTLSVDGQTPVSASSPHTTFSAVNTNDPLYIGGVPASVQRRFTSLGGSFEGCISDVYISQGGREPKGLLLSQAVKENNVTFHTCSI